MQERTWSSCKGHCIIHIYGEGGYRPPGESEHHLVWKWRRGVTRKGHYLAGMDIIWRGGISIGKDSLPLRGKNVATSFQRPFPYQSRYFYRIGHYNHIISLEPNSMASGMTPDGQSYPAVTPQKQM